jgi:hypothetical protein
MYINNPNKIVKVTEWFSNTKYKQHTINTIYQDDKLNVAIQKILDYFNYSNIYLWDTDSIEFNAELPDINPFNVVNKGIQNKEKIYKAKFGIFLRTEINIVQKETLKKINLDKLYCGYKRPVIIINEIALNSLFEKNNDSEITNVIITKYNFDTNINLDNKVLKYYYYNIDTKNIDNLIWIYDNYNKHFNIKNNSDYDILQFFDEKIHKTEKLILFNKLQSTKTFYFIEIEPTGYINIFFKLENKFKYNISTVLEIKENIRNLLNNTFKQETFEFNDKLLKTQATFKIQNFSIDEFDKKTSKIYDFVTKTKKFYIYNRTNQDNNNNYSIEDYIKDLKESKYTDNDIIDLLKNSINEKITEEEIIDLINSENTIKRNISFTTKTHFTITSNDKHTILVNIFNINSIIELCYMLFWLSKIINDSSKVTKKPIHNKKSTSSSSSDVIINNSSSSDSLSSGGMPKKKNFEKETNLLSKLKNLDKKLFTDDNLNQHYPRLCQSNRQPVGLPNDKFKPYENSVDNHLTINNNTYFCPRYWCPISEKPILDKTKDKCNNDNEEPVDLYKNIVKNFDSPDKPKYVSYVNNTYLKPCCYIKNIKKDIKSNSSVGNNYVLNNYNNIPKGRFGSLSKIILNFIDKKYLLSNVTNVPSRLGIDSNYDLIDIFALIFNFKSRIDLVKHIYNSLDFISFISLENGEIVREFLKKSFYNKSHSKIFSDKFIINKSSRKTIESALTAYIDYLKNEKIMNPHYLYSLIALLFKCNMYIFKYKSDTNFHVINPNYVSYNQLKNLSNTNNAIFIFYNSINDFYEPIVINNNQFIFNTTISNINLFDKFNKDIDLEELFSNIKSSKLKIKLILLNSNLTVSSFVLEDNYLLDIKQEIQPIYLHKLYEFLPDIKTILYDDFYFNYKHNKLNNSKFNNDNFQLIYEPQQKLFSDSIIFYNNITLNDETKLDYVLNNIVDFIYNNIDDNFYNNYDFWKTYILDNYKNTSQFIDNKIFQYFNIFFEEIININKDINKWYIIYNFNNIFGNLNVTFLNNRFLFSNKALKNYQKIFIDKKENIDFIPIENKTNPINNNIFNINFTNSENYALNQKLPNKWSSYNLKYIQSKDYNNYSFYELITILNNNKDISTQIKTLRNNNIKSLFGNKDGFEKLLYIIDYKKIIFNKLEIKSNLPNDNVYIKFNKKSFEEKEIFMNEIIEKLNTSIIDVEASTQFVNINFIVIQYRIFSKNTNPEIKRNSIQDIIGNCNIFFNNFDYPLIILYTDDTRLYFVNYYNQTLNAPENIKEILRYKQ